MLVSPRWLLRHLLLVGALVGCGFAIRWQLGRALSRHSVLNWSYTVEWCLFAGFAVLTWGWFLRDEVRGPTGTVPEAPAITYQPTAPVVSDDEDPELAAYNRYLARLNSKDNA